MQAGGYEIDIVVQGYPGKAVCHGGLGWSTIALLRGHGRVALIDVGSFAYRPFLAGRLAKRGLKPGDVTDVILTHAHHDHAINWVLFSNAKVHIGGGELAWALQQRWGETPVPELYVREARRLNEWVRRSGETLHGKVTAVALERVLHDVVPYYYEVPMALLAQSVEPMAEPTLE